MWCHIWCQPIFIAKIIQKNSRQPFKIICCKTHFFVIRNSRLFPVPQLDFASLHLADGLSPYKSATINAIANKFACRYHFTFVRLVAYSNSIVATGFGVIS